MKRSHHHRFRLFALTAFSYSSLVSGLKVAVIVGTVVNLVNQGEFILAIRMEELSWIKITITYLVPFFVSIYMRTATILKIVPGALSIEDANLRCAKCQKSIKVLKNEVIPECSSCKTESHWHHN